MALIACSECHQAVSEHASQCPQCGFPLNQPSVASVADPVAAADLPVESAPRPEPVPGKKPIPKRIWLAGTSLLICALGAGIWFYSPLQAHMTTTRAKAAYKAGKLPEAEANFEQLAKLGKLSTEANLAYGQLLLELGKLDAAERATDQAIQALYQKRVGLDGLSWPEAQGSALYRKGLIRIARSLAYVEHFEADWAREQMQEALAGSRESFESAHQLLPDQPEWKAAIDFLDNLGRFDKPGALSQANYPAYVAYVRHIPAFQRLSLPPEIKPQPSATPPQGQDEVRAAIRHWQDLKHKAFLTQDSSELESALTGAALEETISAVAWWAQNDAYYNEMKLLDLRFLEISYPDPELAIARVAVKELRDNSREGRTEDSYQANYELERIGTGWYIRKIEVIR